MGYVYHVMIMKELQMMGPVAYKIYAIHKDKFFFKMEHVKHVKNNISLMSQVKTNAYRNRVDRYKCSN